MKRQKPSKTKSEKKLRQALTYELWRSLRAYRSQQIRREECGNQMSLHAPLVWPPRIDATSSTAWRRPRLDSVIKVALSPRNDLTVIFTQVVKRS